MRLGAAALVVVSAGFLASTVAPSGWGDPIPRGDNPTVWRTVTERVNRKIERIGVEGWHARAVHNRQALNRAGKRLRADRREVTALRASIRRQARDYRDDYGIRSSAFLCIHSHEGSWTDPGAPYYGGVQMDQSFMSTYGGPFLRAWGTADHWPAYIQVAVAEYARLSGRGYFPWPNTARACGLL